MPSPYKSPQLISGHYDGQPEFDTSQNFQFTVNPASSAAVPEAGSLPLIVLGILPLTLFAYRRKTFIGYHS